MKKIIILFGVALIIVVVGFFYYSLEYTEQYRGVTNESGFVHLISPQPEQTIESPLVIAGEARGSWYFEGDFPVILTDWDGLIIAEGFASAQGEWMTEEFVPFTATLEFEKPELYPQGSLILIKDNPSGLPENDDALEILIKYF